MKRIYSQELDPNQPREVWPEDRLNEVKENWLSKNPGKTERDFWKYYYH